MLRPSPLDRQVLAFDVTKFAEPFSKGLVERRNAGRRTGRQKTHTHAFPGRLRTTLLLRLDSERRGEQARDKGEGEDQRRSPPNGLLRGPDYIPVARACQWRCAAGLRAELARLGRSRPLKHAEKAVERLFQAPLDQIATGAVGLGALAHRVGDAAVLAGELPEREHGPAVRSGES